MTASAKCSCNFVDIDNVIAAQADFVIVVDWVEEYGDFGAGDSAQGVDDAAEFNRSYGIAVHVLGREVAVDNLPVEGEFAVHHHVACYECLGVRSRVVRLVDDAREVDAFFEQITDDRHRLVAGAAELEGSCVMHDAEV